MKNLFREAGAVLASITRSMLVKHDLARMFKYDPDQPRAPAGDPRGGQWIADEGLFGNDSETRNENIRRLSAKIRELRGDDEKFDEYMKSVEQLAGLKMVDHWKDFKEGFDPLGMGVKWADIPEDQRDAFFELMEARAREQLVPGFSEDVRSHFRDQSAESMDSDERYALEEYIGSGYQAINANYRGGSYSETMLANYDNDAINEQVAQFADEKSEELKEKYEEEERENWEPHYAPEREELQSQLDKGDITQSEYDSGIEDIDMRLNADVAQAVQDRVDSEIEQLSADYAKELGEQYAEERRGEAEHHGENLEHGINKIPPTSTSVLTTRGFSRDYFSMISSVKPGDEIELEGFTSTSTRASVSDGFGKYKLEIVIPKGSKDVLFTNNDAENEILLNHRTKIRVLAKKDYTVYGYFDPAGNSDSADKAERRRKKVWNINFGRMGTDPLRVYPKDRTRKYDPDQPRDYHGRWTNGLTVAGDEDGTRAPQPGDKFIVFRVGSDDTLDNHNAGNAHAVATHMARAADVEAPSNVGGIGDKITAYEVSVSEDFREYQTLNMSRGAKGSAVGRMVNRQQVMYSFPKGGAFTAKAVASMTVKDVYAHLKEKYDLSDFDESGTNIGAQVIRELFAPQVSKKYSPDQPRAPEGTSEGGQWVAEGATESLVGKLVKDKGFTYQPVTGKSPDHGYALSIFRDAEKVLEGEVTVKDLRDYLNKHKDAFKDEHTYVGAWHDGESGKTYLDLSKVVDDEDEARSLAIEHKQEAYYSLHEGKSVYVRARKTETRYGASPTGHERRRTRKSRADFERERKLALDIDWDKRILDAFQSFQDTGDDMMQMVSALHTSRVSAYGFTAEAEATGITRYEISEQLDNRICPVCEEMDGRQFDVEDARASLDEILHVDDPEDLRTLQSWPRQDAQNVAVMKEMTEDELVDLNWHIPPYHPLCRGLLVPVDEGVKPQDTPSYRAAFPERSPRTDANRLLDNLGVVKSSRKRHIRSRRRAAS